MIILDTNVLSEQLRPNPSQTVMAWAATVPSSELFTRMLTTPKSRQPLMSLKEKVIVCCGAEPAVGLTPWQTIVAGNN